MCNSNFPIFDFKKCRNLEIRVRGRSRSLKVVPFDRLYMVSYWCSVVTLSLKRTVLGIFDFKNAVTLKTGLGVRQGHWKYQYSIERIRLPINVLWLYLVSFLRYSMSKNVVTLKSGSEVTEGHWKWHHSVDRVWFPTGVL